MTLENSMKFPAWYGIGVGALILLQWIFFLATGSVPEIQTAPWEIALHISAEMVLALALLTGGVATLRSTRWGEKVLFVALGMAVYSEINSPGYFAQLGQWSLVAMFALLLFGAVWSVMTLLKTGNNL
jgi:hypothetical protein